MLIEGRGTGELALRLAWVLERPGVIDEEPVRFLALASSISKTTVNFLPRNPLLFLPTHFPPHPSLSLSHCSFS